MFDSFEHARYRSVSVNSCWYVHVFVSGSWLYQDKKRSELGENGYVTISRKMVENTDGTKDFFYKKYETSVGAAVDTQIK